MYYQKWNEFLFDHFFNAAKNGQTVLLDISEQDIYDVYTKIFEDAPGDQSVAITNLISALNAGPTIYHVKTKNEQKHASLCEKIKDGYNRYYTQNNQGDIRMGAKPNAPPFFAYAIGLVYALKVTTQRKLYDSFRAFLVRSLKQVGSDEDLRHCIDIIWGTIEQYLENRQGNFGYFFNKKDGALTRRFVDKVYSQFIIPRTELLRLPYVFWELDLTREDGNRIEIPNLFLSRETELKRLIPITLDLLKQNDGDNLLACEVINSLLLSFDGWSPKAVEKTGQVVVEHNVSKLWLSIERSRKTGNFDIGYHFSLPQFEGYLVIFGSQEVNLNEEFWSSKLYQKDGSSFDCPFLLIDNINGLKVIFKPEGSKMYIFASAMDKGFPSQIYLQTKYISFHGRQYLLLHDSVLVGRSEWIAVNNGRQEVISASGWSLWFFERIAIEGEVEPLRYKKTKRFNFQGGLKAKGNHSYVLGYPLKLTLDGAKGDEILFIGDLEPIDYDAEIKAFLINDIKLPGEYRLVVRSPIDGDIDMGDFSRLQFSLMDETGLQQAIEMEIDAMDTYSGKASFMAYQYLQISVGVNHHYPPQLLEWEAQEISLEEGGYSWLAQELLSFIAYRGEMRKAVFIENLIVFFHRYCVMLESAGLTAVAFADFKKRTIGTLTEGCRLIPTYNESGSLIKVTPVSPFLCRLINASSVNSGLKNRATIPFGGELYFLGGCIPLGVIKQVFKHVKEKYSGLVTIKLISEQAGSSLNPPAVYIFIHKPCNFIEVIVGEFKIAGPNNCYSLFPVVGNIHSRLEEVIANPGLHQTFHDLDSCEYFSASDLKFVPLNGHELTEISLSRYKVNNYRSLTILRNGEASSSVQLGWGKYLFLHLIGQDQGQIHYDPKKNTLAFRTTLGLPWPLNRIFYLATGRLGYSLPMMLVGDTLSQVDYGSYFTIYQGILEATASSVISRLGQKFNSENYINIQLSHYDRSIKII